MIGRLQGILLDKGDGEILVDVNGTGYEVELPDSSFYQLGEPGQPVVLYTHFVVREDAQLLFGFCEKQDRELFRLLIKVNGVGPRMALGILSSMDGRQLAGCVARNDINALVKLPGIGKKTAERLLIEMRDRLKHWDFAGPGGEEEAAGVQPPAGDILREAEAALLALGYKPQEASRAVHSARNQLEKDGADQGTEPIIRMALKQLGKA